jgi:non-ribosomal peptide synthetase component E (peptide arylation enzyme)
MRPSLPPDLQGLNVRDFLEDAVRRVPDQPFVVTHDERLTYAEFDARVDRTAAAWQALGVGLVALVVLAALAAGMVALG